MKTELKILLKKKKEKERKKRKRKKKKLHESTCSQIHEPKIGNTR